MRVRMPLIGTGDPDDPYRVDLPLYEMVDVDYVGMRAIVEIRDRYIPTPVAAALQNRPQTLTDPAPQPFPPGLIRLWRDYTDQIYAEHAGEYNLDPV